MNEKKRHPSNIIFNLIALALLLTVIVFLHQILRKSKPADGVHVKSIAALPSAETRTDPQARAKAEVTLPALPPAQQQLAPEPKTEAPDVAQPEPAKQAVVELPAKEPEAKPVVERQKPSAAKTKKASYRAEEEVSPAELDGEEARQKYIRENKKLSSDNARIEKSSTRAASQSSADSDLGREAAKRFEAPSKYDLDDEAARQKYVDENRRLSRTVNTSEKPREQTSVKRTQDEYIPFEDR